MDSGRADTLEALSAYIQHQRSLLARTHADIERLKQLRGEALASHTQGRLGDGDKILGLEAYHPSAAFPDKIDWQTFSSCDPTPLRTLAIQTRLYHTQRGAPEPVQRSPLSALQKFVKDARKIIVDPVLESIYRTTPLDSTLDPISTANNPEPPTTALPTSLSEDESEVHTPSGQEPTRKRKQKKRKVKPDLAVECKLGEEGSDSMSVRHDDGMHSTLPTPVDGASVQGEDDADSSRARRSPDRTSLYPTDLSARSSRIRKPSLKLQSQELAELKDPSSALPSPSSLGKRSRESSEVKSATRKQKTEPPSSVAELNSRSNTYKQAWSISEQHLLERLLNEIPDGERNRWAKISHAMGGQRTPRQVASRVQKYFEKLKRFGLDVEKGK